MDSALALVKGLKTKMECVVEVVRRRIKPKDLKNGKGMDLSELLSTQEDKIHFNK